VLPGRAQLCLQPGILPLEIGRHVLGKRGHSVPCTCSEPYYFIREPARPALPQLFPPQP
jgi:hypothetical protein